MDPTTRISGSVSFITAGGNGPSILVELKSDIEWQGMKPWWISPGRRILYPQTSIDGDGTFGLNPVGPTFIDDFVVTNLFY